MVGRAEALEAINGRLASATIFTTASSDLLATELSGIAGRHLTFTQLKLLRLVDRQGHLTIGDVAAFLGISNAAASKAVDRLVRGGFFSRAESPGDRRATEVSVTSEGRNLLDEFEARSNAALPKLLSGATFRRLRDISGSLDRLSVSLVTGSGEVGRLCFRCGLYLRDECLLRTSTQERCYLHLGSARRSGESLPQERPARAGKGERTTTARTTTGGIG